MKTKKHRTEELAIQNDLKKFKLSMEHGMDFSKGYRSKDLPPEIENQFLDYVDQFEKAYHNAGRISVFDFIGKPKFVKENQLSETELKTELEKISKIMEKKGISLDVIYSVEDRILYHFITEELFPYEIDDIRIAGLISNFIYEEFHPNHVEDIKSHLDRSIIDFFDRSRKFDTIYLTEKLKNNRCLQNYREAFESFTLQQSDIKEVNVDGEKARATIQLEFSGILEGNQGTQNFSGLATVYLLSEYGFWSLDEVDFPIKLETSLEK
jgi:hypothetical protein